MMKPENNKQTTYTSLEQGKVSAPTIKVSKSAIKWLSAIADIHDHEVGVFGFVDELGNDTYLIRDIFYPKHNEANGATCEISPEGETLMAEWLINHGRENDIAKAKFWGHSHVNMGVSPSGQDESQAMERMERTQSYFIRGIFNKEGKMSISFYDYQNKRRFDNVKWETNEDDEEKAIRKKVLELKETNLPKVKIWSSHPTNYPGSLYENDDEYLKYHSHIGGFGEGARRNIYQNFPGTVKKYKKEKNKHKHSYEFEFTK